MKFRDIKVIREIPILASTAARASIKMEMGMKDLSFFILVIINLKMIIFRRTISSDMRTDRKKVFM